MNRTIAVIHAHIDTMIGPYPATEHLYDDVSLLAYQCRKLQTLNDIDQLVIATSSDRIDDKIARIGDAEKIDVYRCAVPDLLDRLLFVAEKTNADSMACISANSPFCDLEVIGSCIADHLDRNADYTSPDYDTCPTGFGGIVISTNVLRQIDQDKIYQRMDNKGLISFLELHAAEFNSNQVKFDIECTPSINSITVHSSQDLELLRSIYKTLQDRDWPQNMYNTCKLLDEISVLNSIIKGLAS